MEKYKFGDFIYGKRKELKLTQDDLGRKLGVTNKAVSKWETGETLPDINLLPSLAKELGVTIDELLTQKKVEPVVEIKKQSVIKYVISIILLSLLSLVLLILAIPKKDSLNIDNVFEYYNIDTNSYSIVDNGVIINGTVDKIKEVSGYDLILVFEVEYSYYNNSDVLIEILYLEREVIIKDTDDSFSLELKPKYSISDFKKFAGLVINYKVKEVR